jgi:hypothetical protein
MTKNYKSIYFVRFASNFCQSAFFPFFAVWLMKEKLFFSTHAALIVSLGILSTRLCAPFFSNTVKKYHKKNVILSSLSALLILFGVLYFLLLQKLHAMGLWVFMSIGIGCALSVNSLALLSYLAIHQDENNHQNGFSFINIALNVSSGLGPFFGAMTLAHYKNLFPLVPMFFSLLSMGALIFLEGDTHPVENNTVKHKEHFSTGGTQFLLFIILNMLTFVGYAQFYDVFPVYASHYVSEKTIGLLFIISSIVIVCVQLPINSALQRFSNLSVISVSNFILALGTLLFIAVSRDLLMIAALGVVLISIAEVMYAPRYQAMAVRLFQPNNPVQALSLQSFSWGIAEAVATFFGIAEVGRGNGCGTFMVGAFCALCVGVIITIYQYRNFFCNDREGSWLYKHDE